MTNSRIRCYRCHHPFDTVFTEQRLCARCRHQVIRDERRAARREARKEITLAQLELQYDQARRAEWDVMIVDENGRDVWARDLAKRYRNELDARQRREYRLKQNDAGMSRM